MTMKNINLLLLMLLALTLLIPGCGKKDSSVTEGKDDKRESSEVTETKKDIDISENTAFHVVYEMAGDNSAILDVYAKGGKGKSEIKSTTENAEFSASAYYPGDGYIYTVTEVAGKKMAIKIKENESRKDKKDFSTYVLKFKDNLKDFDKEGTEEIIGYNCNVYKDKEGNKYYIYRDLIMLKFEGKTGTFTATKLELGANIDDKIFEVPKDTDFHKFDINMFKKK